MNATEKAHMLRNAGYTLENDNYGCFVWRDGFGVLVACENKNTAAITRAYKHYCAVIQFEGASPTRNQPEPAPQLATVPDVLAKNGRVLIERGSVFQAPKFGIGDKVLYYGKLFWVLSADFVNGTYAYQLQDTDGEIIGALIAESEIESPVQSEIVEIPDVLAEAREREELYLTQIAEYQKFNVEKDERIAKLEGDLKAAQAIIVQAGAMVEKKSHSLLDALEANVQLKRDNERMKDCLKRVYAFPQIKDAAISMLIEDILGLNDSASEESPNAAQAVTLSDSEIYYYATQDPTKMKWGLLAMSEANRAAIEARRTTLAQS